MLCPFIHSYTLHFLNKTRFSIFHFICKKGASMRMGRHSFALLFCHKRQYHSRHQQQQLLHKSKQAYALYDTNIRLTNLGRLGRLDDAIKLFDKMPNRDVVSYTSMITLYINNNHLAAAEKLFHSIPFTNRNIVLDSAMIHAYAKAGHLEQAYTIFHQMPTRNVYSWTSLISGHFMYGHVYEAQKLFDQMPHHIKNIVSWTTVLLGYAHNGFIHQARVIFDQIPNKNVVAWTAMIKAYIQHSQTDHALQLFNAMPQRNLYSWNIMIQGLFNNNMTEEAIGLFCSMPRKNTVSWTTMVTGLGNNGYVKLARDYFNQMPKKDIAAWNAMITAYTGQGLMDEATQLFRSMPQRNIVSWNAVMSGYANVKGAGGGQAMKHLILLLQCSSINIRPNESTLTCVLTSCEEDYMGLSQTHALATRLGVLHDLSFTNALITMYAKCGDLESAKHAFDTCETKDLVSWTAMMLAYSTHGLGSHAIENFARMLRLGYEPDEITFAGLLTACSHTGLVTKGLRFFSSMKKGFNLEPEAEHYACLVDMLGRAGELDKALKVVLETMHHHHPPPPKDAAAVLGALLGACKLHGDDELANEIGQRVIQLEPTASGGYVLLANAFAASGKWEEVAKVRRQMKQNVTSKIPGFSQVCVKGGNHVFYVGDRSHTKFGEIDEMLRVKLLPQMQLKPI